MTGDNIPGYSTPQNAINIFSCLPNGSLLHRLSPAVTTSVKFIEVTADDSTIELTLTVISGGTFASGTPPTFSTDLVATRVDVELSTWDADATPKWQPVTIVNDAVITLRAVDHYNTGNSTLTYEANGVINIINNITRADTLAVSSATTVAGSGATHAVIDKKLVFYFLSNGILPGDTFKFRITTFSDGSGTVVENTASLRCRATADVLVMASATGVTLSIGDVVP